MKHCNALYITLSLLVPFFYSFGMERPTGSNEQMNPLINKIKIQQNILSYQKPKEDIKTQKYFQTKITNIKNLEKTLKSNPNDKQTLQTKQMSENDLETDAITCINMIISDGLYIKNMIEQRFRNESVKFLNKTIEYNEKILKQRGLFHRYEENIGLKKQKPEPIIISPSATAQSLIVRKQKKEEKKEEEEQEKTLLKGIIETYPGWVNLNPGYQQTMATANFSIYNPAYLKNFILMLENYEPQTNYYKNGLSQVILYITHVAMNNEQWPTIEDKLSYIQKCFQQHTLDYLKATWELYRPKMAINIPSKEENLPLEETGYVEEIFSEEEEEEEEGGKTITEQPISTITPQRSPITSSQPTLQPTTQPAQPEEQPNIIYRAINFIWNGISSIFTSIRSFFGW